MKEVVTREVRHTLVTAHILNTDTGKVELQSFLLTIATDKRTTAQNHLNKKVLPENRRCINIQTIEQQVKYYVAPLEEFLKIATEDPEAMKRRDKYLETRRQKLANQ